MLTIFNKELVSYFKSSIAYFVILVYLGLTMLANFYQANYFDVPNQGLISMFYFQPDIFILIIPALCMKLWADERKNGTLEILFTRPLNISSIIIGKFLSSLFLALLVLFSTIPLVIYTSRIIELDYNMILNSYLACVFMIMSFCALGSMVSAFCNNPIIAYIVSVLLLWTIKSLSFNFLIDYFGKNNELMYKTAQSINFSYHYQNFLFGQINLSGVLYFVLIIAMSLWGTNIAIEYKRD